MKNSPFIAYENEEDVVTVDEMKIQNGTGALSISGAIKLTKDIDGLNKAFKIKRIIDSAIDEIKRDKNFPFNQVEPQNY